MLFRERRPSSNGVVQLLMRYASALESLSIEGSPCVEIGEGPSDGQYTVEECLRHLSYLKTLVIPFEMLWDGYDCPRQAQNRTVLSRLTSSIKYLKPYSTTMNMDPSRTVPETVKSALARVEKLLLACGPDGGLPYLNDLDRTSVLHDHGADDGIDHTLIA